MLSLKNHNAVGDTRANTADVRAHETLNQMTQLRSIVAGLTWTLDGECKQVSDLFDVELS